MPGSPPIRTTPPATRPPPSTRSNSSMPVPKRGTSIASMSASDSTGAVCARLRCGVCDMRFTPGVSTTVSTIVFQALQSAHWPVQRVAIAPHSLQV